MGSRSRALGLAGLLLTAGCRLHVTQVTAGGDWTLANAQAVAATGGDRGDVLRRLGPPDEVFYTLREEVLLYRRARHQGSDLRFLVPDPSLNRARPGLEQMTPELSNPEDFAGEAPPIAVMRGIMETVFGLLNPVSSEEAVSMHSRALRWDIARVVLDRDTLAVQSVEVHRGIDPGAAQSIARRSLLLPD